MLNNMKINKILFNKEQGNISVWTSVFPNMGFNFNLDEIVDKADLKAKVISRVQAEQLRITNEELKQDRFTMFKDLVGKDI